ncbi:MAG: hypothetical protein OEL82_10010 [Nitrosopumilus sp.]|nr:hypothetical protein [Nitrosopumilus sp.]
MRHSSITEKTDVLNDFQLKQYAGWGINSTRPRTYVHRKGKQVINPLLEEHGIIQIPETTKSGTSVTSQEIPSWIKNNADWWSQGLISDDDFLKGIQFMVENGIIAV